MDGDAAKEAVIRRRVLTGTLANYAGQLVTLGVGFLLTPFVLHHLGAASYGLWILVGSVVSYGALLDFGIATAIVKYVAEYRARHELEQARSLVATALILYAALGFVAFLLSVALAPVFPSLFQVPQEERGTASLLVLLSGLGVGLAIPGAMPIAILRGLHRFDLVNAISITGTLLATAATVGVLQFGGGVLGMVAVNLPVSVLMQVPSIWLIHRIAPELRPGWRDARRSLAGTVVAFSSALFVSQMAGRLQTKTDEIVIGGFLPVTAVTPYALARRLSEIAQLLTNQFMKVLLPIASELDANRDLARLRQLYVTSTRLALALFLPLGGTMVVLAGPVLTVWVGPQFADSTAIRLVLILTVASCINTSQWPAGSILQGMARHRFLALTALGSGLANLALSLLLVRRFGLIGVAVGTLLPTAVECLALVLPYAIRIIGVGIGTQIKEIYLPVLLPLLPMLAAIYLAERALAPSSLPPLALIAVVGVLLYSVIYLRIGAGEFERHALRNAVFAAADAVRAHSRRVRSLRGRGGM